MHVSLYCLFGYSLFARICYRRHIVHVLAICVKDTLSHQGVLEKKLETDTHVHVHACLC